MKNVLSPISEKRISRNPDTIPSVKGLSPTMPGIVKVEFSCSAAAYADGQAEAIVRAAARAPAQVTGRVFSSLGSRMQAACGPSCALAIRRPSNFDDLPGDAVAGTGSARLEVTRWEAKGLTTAGCRRKADELPPRRPGRQRRAQVAPTAAISVEFNLRCVSSSHRPPPRCCGSRRPIGQGDGVLPRAALPLLTLPLRGRSPAARRAPARP